MLKPGGMILYSTCTFDAEENEGTIEYLLNEYPEFFLKDIVSYDGFAEGKPEVTEGKSEEFRKTVRIRAGIRRTGKGIILLCCKREKKGRESSAEKTKKR